MYKFLCILAACAGLLVLPSTLHAAEVQNTDTVHIAKNETRTGNIYFMGQDIIIEGTVTGDVIVLANSVHISGIVTGSVLGITNTIDVSGQVGGSIRTISANATISGDVMNDITLICNQLIVAKQAHIHGIAGYFTPQSQILGTIDGAKYDVYAQHFHQPTVSDSLYNLAESFLSLSLLGVLLYSLQTYITTESLYYTLRKHFVRHTLVGLSVAVFGTAAIVLLILSGIGRSFGVFLFAAGLFCTTLGIIDSAYMVGRLIATRQQPVPSRTVVVFLIGNLLLVTVLRVPLLGLLSSIFILAGLGNRLSWLISIIKYEPIVNE